MMKWLVMLAYLIVVDLHAAIAVIDDDGQTVTLQKPATRIISLSPAITEMIFAAGGGDRLVGVIKYSDYPEAAKRIPVIGDSRELDLERVITLKPDLFVVWKKGSSAKKIEQLRKLRIPMYFLDEHKLSDIAGNIRQLGHLLGTEQQANKIANDLQKQFTSLANQYTHLSPVRLFYQVWSNPLYTLNGQQIVSDAIRLCGGANVFANQKMVATNVSIESVLEKNPEAIVGAKDQNASVNGVEMWKRYPNMTAVKQHNLFEIDGNLINRAGPRMVVGVTDLCQKLDQARKNRR